MSIIRKNSPIMNQLLDTLEKKDELPSFRMKRWIESRQQHYISAKYKNVELNQVSQPVSQWIHIRLNQHIQKTRHIKQHRSEISDITDRKSNLLENKDQGSYQTYGQDLIKNDSYGLVIKCNSRRMMSVIEQLYNNSEKHVLKHEYPESAKASPVRPRRYRYIEDQGVQIKEASHKQIFGLQIRQMKMHENRELKISKPNQKQSYTSPKSQPRTISKHSPEPCSTITTNDCLQSYFRFMNDYAGSSCFTAINCEIGPFKYSIGRGNNSRLVEKTFKNRWWWVQHEDDLQPPNFRWTQLSDSNIHNRQSCFSKEQSLPRNQLLSHLIQSHNHLELSQNLGNKKAFFYNIKKYYELNDRNPFDNIPITFHVMEGVEDLQFQKFTQYYQHRQLSKKQRNIWIVKPGECTNRGTGIQIFDQYEQIKEAISTKAVHANKKRKTFIIQQYLERPFLIQKRKFDIRCYILITSHNGIIRGYWYEEGYIRTSSLEYNLKGSFDPFIHLTNDAVQKNSELYGKHENGNKISFCEFQKYLDSWHSEMGVNFLNNVLPKMKSQAIDCVRSVFMRIDPKRRLHNFEIFGLDFMLDSQLRPWLIEVNTNPCLELSSTLLSRIIPQMLENAFRIGLDPLFPPPQKWPKKKKYQINEDPYQTNRFALIFDERFEGQFLRKLYQNVESDVADSELEENQNDDQF